MCSQNILKEVTSNSATSKIFSSITKTESIKVLTILVGAGVVLYLVNCKYSVSCKYQGFELNLSPR